MFNVLWYMYLQVIQTLSMVTWFFEKDILVELSIVTPVHFEDNFFSGLVS